MGELIRTNGLCSQIKKTVEASVIEVLHVKLRFIQYGELIKCADTRFFISSQGSTNIGLHRHSNQCSCNSR